MSRSRVSTTPTTLFSSRGWPDMTDATIQAPGRPGMDAPGEFVLQAESITAGYDKIPFLKDVDFGVRSGEVVALLGANGAGKTTLIMTLAGHVKPAAGQVLLRGQVQHSSMDQRVHGGGLSVITQDRSVFMTLTVRQNIRLGRGDIGEALSLFPELEPHLGRKVGHLSGGQQQMLAVARAICARPSVILADEVSLGLGPKIVDRLLDVLTKVASDKDVAVVIVEQFVNKALRFSDRAYVLNRGRIAVEGSSRDMLGRTDELAKLYV